LQFKDLKKLVEDARWQYDAHVVLLRSMHLPGMHLQHDLVSKGDQMAAVWPDTIQKLNAINTEEKQHLVDVRAKEAAALDARYAAHAQLRAGIRSLPRLAPVIPDLKYSNGYTLAKIHQVYSASFLC
jgi:hypothetical protein